MLCLQWKFNKYLLHWDLIIKANISRVFILCWNHFKYFVCLNSFNPHNNSNLQVPFLFSFYREGNWDTESFSNLPRVRQLISGEADFSLADSMLLTRLLFCLLEGSGMWKSHRPIKTVIREKKHLLILFSFHLFNSSKRKPLGRQPEKTKIQCLAFVTKTNR